MAIAKKGLDECSEIRYVLCGDIKRLVYERQEKEYKEKGRRISQAHALTKLILEKYDNSIITH